MYNNLLTCKDLANFQSGKAQLCIALYDVTYSAGKLITYNDEVLQAFRKERVLKQNETAQEGFEFGATLGRGYLDWSNSFKGAVERSKVAVYGE